MLKLLADYESVWGPFRLFRYLSFRGAMAAGTSLFIGFAIGPWIILRLRELKLAQSLRNKSEVGDLAALHASKKDTPTMGGIIIYISVIVSVLLWADLNTYVLTAILVFTGLALLGFVDDYLKIKHNNSKGLSGRYKIAGQLIITAAALLMLLGSPLSQGKMLELWVPFLKEPLIYQMPVPFALFFLFLVLGGSSNAINLTDGVDGLAIGCIVTVVLVYGIMAYTAGNSLIAAYLFISYVPGRLAICPFHSAMLHSHCQVLPCRQEHKTGLACSHASQKNRTRLHRTLDSHYNNPNTLSAPCSE